MTRTTRMTTHEGHAWPRPAHHAHHARTRVSLETRAMRGARGWPTHGAGRDGCTNRSDGGHAHDHPVCHSYELQRCRPGLHRRAPLPVRRPGRARRQRGHPVPRPPDAAGLRPAGDPAGTGRTVRTLHGSCGQRRQPRPCARPRPRDLALPARAVFRQRRRAARPRRCDRPARAAAQRAAPVRPEPSAQGRAVGAALPGAVRPARHRGSDRAAAFHSRRGQDHHRHAGRLPVLRRPRSVAAPGAERRAAAACSCPGRGPLCVAAANHTETAAPCLEAAPA
jgi:hypothetical protein